jgi:hypothetical protein
MLISKMLLYIMMAGICSTSLCTVGRIIKIKVVDRIHLLRTLSWSKCPLFVGGSLNIDIGSR